MGWGDGEEVGEEVGVGHICLAFFSICAKKKLFAESVCFINDVSKSISAFLSAWLFVANVFTERPEANSRVSMGSTCVQKKTPQS